MKRVAAALSILMLLLAPESRSQKPQIRPPVGVPLDAVNFHGKWYRLYIEKGGWRRARDRCKVLGGQLAVIVDDTTNQFIMQLAGDIPVWLGATDNKLEGVWQWSDGSRMTFNAWHRGQPEGARNEDYLCLFPNQGWHDAFEGEPKIVGFVCEWPHK